jgi:hypothetical protein
MSKHVVQPPHARTYTHTHNYVIFIAFPQQQWFANVPQCYVIRTLSVLIIIYMPQNRRWTIDKAAWTTENLCDAVHTVSRFFLIMQNFQRNYWFIMFFIDLCCFRSPMCMGLVATAALYACVSEHIVSMYLFNISIKSLHAESVI